MKLKDFNLKLKWIRVRVFLGGDGKKKRNAGNESSKNLGRNLSWMVPISHGYHHIEDSKLLGRISKGSEIEAVVVQREQIEEHELWLFGVFDAEVADGVIKYLESNLFNNKKHKESLKKRSKETLKKAHIYARTKIKERNKEEETCKMGSASAIVIDGEKLIIASMGEYSSVVCRHGQAHQVHRKHHWLHRRINTNGDRGGSASCKSSEPLVIFSERIYSDTEFVILANAGIWEVMKHQEAVSLIRHLEDPQEAAEFLANEALSRMCRSNISCLIIRFESFD